MKIVHDLGTLLFLTAAIILYRSKESIQNETSPKASETTRAAILQSEDSEGGGGGPSQQLKSNLMRTRDAGKEDQGGRRRGRDNYDYSRQPQQIVLTSDKIRPGQYAADKFKRKTKNWKLPDFLKGAVAPSDSKVSWSYWEADDSESWPDDADDSQPPTEAPTTTPTTTTTTTTTTPAPTTTKATKGPVSVHKHYHYFKKAAPWPDPAPMPDPPEEMMMPAPMPEEMMPMMNEMMKGMMTMTPEDMEPTKAPLPAKKGLSGVLYKLSAVDPVTILVAGIIPASLILAAALPSVMKQMTSKGDAVTSPPTMTTPMVMTTAMGDSDMMMGDMGGSRSGDDRESRMSGLMGDVLRSAGRFGIQALREPGCARGRFCRLARESLVSQSPEFRSVLRVAAFAIRDSWLDTLGVGDILQSLSQGTCDETSECEDIDGPTTPIPPLH